jgi:hypothetical protein
MSVNCHWSAVGILQLWHDFLMRKIVTAVIAVSSLTLFACGKTETTAPTTTNKPTTTTTTTVPVTTTTLSPQQAAQASYFYIVAETNPLTQAIREKYADSDGSLSWSKAPAFCGEAANVSQRYGQLLATTVWPPEYQPQVTDVIAKNSVETNLYFKCAGLPGTRAAQYATDEEIAVAQKEGSAATSILRGVLGLPIER